MLWFHVRHHRDCFVVVYGEKNGERMEKVEKPQEEERKSRDWIKLNSLNRKKHNSANCLL